MDSDYTVEIGGGAPAIEAPWSDPDGLVAYVDLKRHPERLHRVPELEKASELAYFLTALNAADSPWQTSKCDVWLDEAMNPEEDIFAAPIKRVSYVDVFLCDPGLRSDFRLHERFARVFVDQTKRTLEFPAASEFVLRRAIVEGAEGYGFTIYVTGYGADEVEATVHWAVALRLLENRLLGPEMEDGIRDKSELPQELR